MLSYFKEMEEDQVLARLACKQWAASRRYLSMAAKNIPILQILVLILRSLAITITIVEAVLQDLARLNPSLIWKLQN